MVRSSFYVSLMAFFDGYSGSVCDVTTKVNLVISKVLGFLWSFHSMIRLAFEFCFSYVVFVGFPYSFNSFYILRSTFVK